MLKAFRIPISWTEIFKRTAREVQADNCLGLAAELAYYFFLALFPALLFFVALVSFIPIAGLMDAIATVLARVAPNRAVYDIIHDQILRIAGDSRPVGARHDLGSIGFGRLAQVRPGSEQLIQHGGFLRRGQGLQR